MGEELEADFQREYRLDLRSLIDSRDRKALSVAALAAHLPAGCRVWQALGGPSAWSDEVAALKELDYRLRVLAWQKTKDAQSGRNVPELPTPPPSRVAAQAAEAKLHRRVARYLQ